MQDNHGAGTVSAVFYVVTLGMVCVLRKTIACRPSHGGTKTMHFAENT